MKGVRPKDAAIDLGLAISGALLPPHHTRTEREIAAFCGVSHSAIQQIEMRALRKMRIRLLERGITESEAKMALKLFR